MPDAHRAMADVTATEDIMREQIIRRIREMILSGELPEHHQLPSIRGLARQERVGVVTVQRCGSARLVT